MGEEFLVGRAEIVETGFAVWCAHEAVLGALTVTSKTHGAFTAIAREIGLGAPEGFLRRGVHQRCQVFVEEVTEPIAWVNVVVAAINIAVVLDGEGATASGGKYADTRRLTEPICECAVKVLDENPTDIGFDPLIKNTGEEVAVFTGADAPWCDLRVEVGGVIVIRGRRQP